MSSPQSTIAMQATGCVLVPWRTVEITGQRPASARARAVMAGLPLRCRGVVYTVLDSAVYEASSANGWRGSRIAARATKLWLPVPSFGFGAAGGEVGRQPPSEFGGGGSFRRAAIEAAVGESSSR